MTALALAALAVAALASAAPATGRVPHWLGAIVASIGLGVAGAVAASAAHPLTGIPLALAVVLCAAAAATGGVSAVPTLFRIARRSDGEVMSHDAVQHDASPVDDRPVLRGGLWIGVLERLAVAVSVMTGWPEGIAVVLAVKGLARYPEVREAHASEHFIIGTFTSVLWALAAGGIGAGLLR